MSEGTLYLDSVRKRCLADAARCEQIVDDFVQKLVSTLGRLHVPARREAVVPTIRTASYATAGRARTCADAQFEPFLSDLCIVYVVDSPEAARVLSNHDLLTLGLSKEELAALARANLRRILAADKREPKLDDSGKVAINAFRRYYESSRLLPSDEWDALAKTARGTIVVGVPENDVLLVGIDLDTQKLAALRNAVADGYGRKGRPVSRELFQWRAGKWEVLPE